VKESPFYLLYGQDPRLPTVLDMDGGFKGEVDTDTYKEEITSKMNEALELARGNIKKAQKSQKICHDQRSKPLNFKVGDRVMVYIPAAKACKAYKFARPFHSPYRIIAQGETGAVIRPVDKPQAKSIRVAYDRLRYCSKLLPDKFWPIRATGSGNNCDKKMIKENIESTTNQQPRSYNP